MDLTYFSTLSFEENELTKISCPFCGPGKLFCTKGSVNFASDLSIEELDLLEVDFIFSGMLKCNDTKYSSPISCGGKSEVFEDCNDFTPGTYYNDRFFPQWFYPHINLFDIPPDCPESVKDQVHMSFSMFFNNPMAAGVHIRVALERLMDEECIPEEGQNNNGKLVRLTLHKRIESYEQTEAELEKYLMAIKWLGNEASHSGQLTKTDILDGYEVISHVFTERYERRAREARAVSKAASLIIKFKP